MKVIVTGATGFFGPAIVARLRDAGHEAIGASRRTHAEASLDVTDPESCRALLASQPGTGAIVHAAALAHVPHESAAASASDAVNAGGTRNMAEAAADAGIRRFIFISSVMVYGDYDLPVPVTERTMGGSVAAYGRAKRDAESALESLASRLDVWTLRMATMYSSDWLFNVRKRVAPPLVGRHVYFTLDPHGRRYSLCSRRNGAEAVLWAVDGRIPPDVYNVADQHVYSQRDILRAVETIEGRKPHLPVPTALPRAAAAIAAVVPFASMRENARSRYWKFCEHNVYSSDKLAAFGVPLPADLLDIGRPA